MEARTIIDIVNELYQEIDGLLKDSFVLDQLAWIINRKKLERQNSISLQELISIIKDLSKDKFPKERPPKERPLPKFPIMKLEDWERLMILTALEKTKGNQSEAARLLDITPRQMSFKVKHKFKLTEYTRKKGCQNDN